jgi:NADP-dependent 3-hydroxy acid dehydrogenase YdfG
MTDPKARVLGRMDGRVALVTGASSGIGAGIVRQFLDVGGRVHAAARRKQQIADMVGEDAVRSGRCVPHELDVSDQRAVAELGAHLARTDPIDTLVCAAGVNVPQRRMAELSIDDWHTLVNVNLNGVFYCLRATLDQLRERAGDLVVISSAAASWPDHSGAGYGATKSGLLGLARGTGIDEHANGVRVSTILPGIVDTPILDKRPIPPSPKVREWSLKPEDIAAACLLAVTLPPRANIAEMTMVATRLQSLGKTQQANPELPPQLAGA